MFLLFPTQLFRNIKLLKNQEIYLIEEPYYFTRLNFHKLKIAYHRATMKKYFENLTKKRLKINYIDFNQVDKFYQKHKNQEIQIYHPVDLELLNKLKKLFKNLIIHPTLNFTFTHLDIDEYKKVCYRNNKFYHDDFYKYQRQKLNILMDKDKPIGKKWSFDTENRKAFPKNNLKIPDLPKIKKNKFITEAISYTLKHFNSNYGSLENFIYPISLTESRKWLLTFLKERLNQFGDFQDAVSSKIPFGFHSVISPMMNLGLITDMEVIEISYQYYLKNKSKISLASFEGFIRQVIGWRNYVYLIYLIRGLEMKEENFLDHQRKLTKKTYQQFWEGNTGIIVIDDIIKKMVNYAYSHHIERLMYLGNYLLINLYHPDEVYRLFMEWTIDAYDWVMVPNVYGMSQFADGGKMMTRVYFSSSNYISKMSDYKRNKDDDWWIKWDALYYNFIREHKTLLEKNYATSRQVIHWKNKSKKEQDEIIKTAKNLIN
jgi:deoxyribodipyrimidine photolyase-related protein